MLREGHLSLGKFHTQLGVSAEELHTLRLEEHIFFFWVSTCRCKSCECERMGSPCTCAANSAKKKKTRIIKQKPKNELKQLTIKLCKQKYPFQQPSSSTNLLRLANDLYQMMTLRDNVPYF
jgi:hypothetical protein